MKLTLILLLTCGICFGETWHVVPSGTSKKLNTIEFPSAEVGYIGGDDGVLLKTVNGGRTWEALAYEGIDFINDISDNIINLKFVNNSTGYLTCGPYSNGVFKTTDGGLTWEVQTATEGIICFNYGLYFFGEDNGFFGGSGCFTNEQIHKIDGATSSPATIHDLPVGSEMIVDIDFYDPNFGIAVSGYTGSGRIFRTTDGGENWNTILSGLPDDVPLTSVDIINDTLIYAGYDSLGEGFGMLISTDGGLTWSMDGDAATFYYPAYHATHESGGGKIYVGAETSFDNAGLIFSKTIDGFWSIDEVEEPIFAIADYGDSVVWVIGENGYIVVNQDPEKLSIPKQDSEFHISVYPNPAYEFIQLSGLNLNEENMITLFNLSGDIVQQFVYDGQPFSVSHLARGVYLIQVSNTSGTLNKRFIKH